MQFLRLSRYEFHMSIRRPGFWIAYILLGAFYSLSVLAPSLNVEGDVIAPEEIWAEAGHIVFMFNIFMPILAGILSADRMQRDFRLGTRELQISSPLSTSTYILAKYLGVLASVLLPIFLFSFLTGGLLIARGLAPLSLLWPMFLAFLAIVVPSHAFVVAFSLACPLIMPLRVYQVLYTGYWFWGNMLSPKAFPTISDTVLNAIGQYPLQAYFEVMTDSTGAVTQAYTPTQAVLNLLVLAGCVTCVMVVLYYYLRWQARKA